jgi:steroid delta-isomerase-like uncharacterized protein
MSDANKQLMQRFYEEVFSKGNLDAIDELVAEDCVEHSPPPGFPMGDLRTALKQFTQMMRDAIPDVHFTVDQVIAEGDLTAAYWTAEGTFQGELFGVPPSGNRVSFAGVDLVRAVDGKATDHWGFDNMMMQLGGGPPTG